MLSIRHGRLRGCGNKLPVHSGRSFVWRQLFWADLDGCISAFIFDSAVESGNRSIRAGRVIGDIHGDGSLGRMP